ncbi:uncharacterized protein LOC127476563 [Manacus candei]|uniref:uncharacterized protein LOC127476563 n=1 Tax=Manacus candei TaxID=415023 RepID=UPI002225E7CB|nr:uncharacterized protein LOC127476563 [Manacus candei]
MRKDCRAEQRVPVTSGLPLSPYLRQRVRGGFSILPAATPPASSRLRGKAPCPSGACPFICPHPGPGFPTETSPLLWEGAQAPRGIARSPVVWVIRRDGSGRYDVISAHSDFISPPTKGKWLSKRSPRGGCRQRRDKRTGGREGVLSLPALDAQAQRISGRRSRLRCPLGAVRADAPEAEQRLCTARRGPRGVAHRRARPVLNQPIWAEEGREKQTGREEKNNCIFNEQLGERWFSRDGTGGGLGRGAAVGPHIHPRPLAHTQEPPCAGVVIIFVNFLSTVC